MQFAMTSDYLADTGSPESALRAIAAAGWKYVHWCHHWNDDFLYGLHELAQLEAWLKELGLGMLDIHASHGREKAWDSAREYERQAGVDLVKNRLEMAARLGCRVIILHPARTKAEGGPKRWDSLRRSLTDLLPDLRRLGVRIAIENMAEPDTFDQLDQLMAEFSPEVAGLCYDSGHGCIAGNGLDRLAPLAPRLIALHLNDNDGQGDLHQPPFMGRVDWARLAGIVRQSGYDRPAMSVEVVVKNSGLPDEGAFLRQTLERVQRFGTLL